MAELSTTVAQTRAAATKAAQKPGQARSGAADAPPASGAASFSDLLAARMDDTADAASPTRTTTPGRDATPAKQTTRSPAGGRTAGEVPAEEAATETARPQAPGEAAAAAGTAEALAAAVAAQQALTVRSTQPTGDGPGQDDATPDADPAIAKSKLARNGARPAALPEAEGRSEPGRSEAKRASRTSLPTAQDALQMEAHGGARRHALESEGGKSARAGSTDNDAGRGRHPAESLRAMAGDTPAPVTAAGAADRALSQGMSSGTFAEHLHDAGATGPATAADPGAFAAQAVAAQPTLATNMATHRAAGAETPVYTVATPMADPRWGDDIARVVSIGVREQVQVAEIRIDPADLGPIRMQVTLDGDTASVSFSVSQPETQTRLEQSLDRLRDALADSGIRLGEATVQSGGSGQAGGDRGDGRSRSARADGAETDHAARVIAAPGRRPSGLVDTFA